MWHAFDHVETLENKVTHKPLSFSMMVCKTGEDRPEVTRLLASNPLFGTRGTTIWGRSNLARYHREGRNLLRLITCAIEELVPGRKSGTRAGPTRSSCSTATSRLRCSTWRRATVGRGRPASIPR
eukprot:4644382-Alexandrium_andersonii.AAC.1